MSLPRVTPMQLARFNEPFEHLDWIFEPKMDRFRAVAYFQGGTGRLVSRNRNAFKTFESLAHAIAQDLTGRFAILDGEIVRLGPDGRPMFYHLIRHRPCVQSPIRRARPVAVTMASLLEGKSRPG